jgi:hypothetical protein
MQDPMLRLIIVKSRVAMKVWAVDSLPHMGSGLELQIQLGCILFVLASSWADKHCEHLSKGYQPPAISAVYRKVAHPDPHSCWLLQQH